MNGSAEPRCVYEEHVYGFVIGALSAGEVAQFAPHLAECSKCRSDVEALRPIMASFVHWPSDVLRPSASLWDRLSERLERRPDEENHQIALVAEELDQAGGALGRVRRPRERLRRLHCNRRAIRWRHAPPSFPFDAEHAMEHRPAFEGFGDVGIVHTLMAADG